MSSFGPWRHSGLDAGVVVARRSGVQCSGADVQWQCRGDGEVGAAKSVGLPVASPSLDLVRFSYGWVTAAQVNLVVQALIPTSLYIVLCDRGPPTILGLGAPDQGVDPRAQ